MPINKIRQPSPEICCNDSRIKSDISSFSFSLQIFLSLNKKQSKYRDIIKAKCLGSIEGKKLGLKNMLDPEALRLSMVPNINIPVLLVQSTFKINDFWWTLRQDIYALVKILIFKKSKKQKIWKTQTRQLFVIVFNQKQCIYVYFDLPGDSQMNSWHPGKI